MEGRLRSFRTSVKRAFTVPNNLNEYEEETDRPPLETIYEDEVSEMSEAGIVVKRITTVRIPSNYFRHRPARSYFVSLATFIYALVMISFALVVELSPEWKSRKRVMETIWHAWMYGVGSLFLAFLYIVVLYPRPFNYVLRLIRKWTGLRTEHLEQTRPKYGGEGAGSLFLRLGALVFGCSGIVLYGLELFAGANDRPPRTAAMIIDVIFAMIFLFFSVHFITVCSKITLRRFKSLCKVGFMHLMAVNFWIWFRFVIAKQYAKDEKKAKKKLKLYGDSKEAKMKDHKSGESSTSSSSEEEGSGYEATTDDILEAVVTVITSTLSSTNRTTTEYSPYGVTTQPSMITLAQEHFGDFATILTTFLVEFAVIGAATMFIIWKSIGNPEDNHHDDEESKARHRVSLDCTSATIGLFLGIVTIIAALVTMGIYVAYEGGLGEDKINEVAGIWKLVMFIVMWLASLFAIWRTSKLKFTDHSGEILDEILLIVALLGELVYCACEINVFTTNREGFVIMEPFVFVTFIIRMLQCITQSILILSCFRLQVCSIDSLPGKQIISFLLMCNISMFIFHVFEGLKEGFGYGNYTETSYLVIIYAISPLIVFYRFHSSVCLAEIWSHVYHPHHAEGDHSHPPVPIEPHRPSIPKATHGPRVHNNSREIANNRMNEMLDV